jgi:hypothetical protein
MGWQPIETAPDEGEWLLVYASQAMTGVGPVGIAEEDRIRTAKLSADGRWWTGDEYDSDHLLPSHWMRRPTPPEAKP